MPDTPANRKLLQGVADDDTGTLGTTSSATRGPRGSQEDGSQVWVQTRNGEIINGGVNPTPRAFRPQTGLSAPKKPKGKKRP